MNAAIKMSFGGISCRLCESMLHRIEPGQHVLTMAPTGSTSGFSLEFLVGAKGISRQIRELKRLAVSNVWLHGDRLQQLQRPMLCRIRHRRHLEGGATVLADACFAGIAHDGGEFIEQRAKAVHG